MATTEVSAQLVKLGWNPKDAVQLRLAVEAFQQGYALPGQPALLVDGKAGPKTRAAITRSVLRLQRGEPTASAHFSFSEWRCRCGGRYAGCRVILVHRELLVGLEDLRAQHYPSGLSIVSGYRCPIRNAKVGGATDSQHLYGGASDVEYAVSDVAVKRLRRFSGIGRSASTHKVRHVDVRHLTGHNSTHGTPARPTIWNYAH
jgi:zinc D-Ala-D-Ala carboxypeptidase